MTKKEKEIRYRTQINAVKNAILTERKQIAKDMDDLCKSLGLCQATIQAIQQYFVKRGDKINS